MGYFEASFAEIDVIHVVLLWWVCKENLLEVFPVKGLSSRTSGRFIWLPKCFEASTVVVVDDDDCAVFDGE